MKKVAIFGGSFNPVHNAHLILANIVRQLYDFNEVWFMLSPLNPLKQNNRELISDTHRLEMLKLALKDATNMVPCDIELSMPRPSYTIDTLHQVKKLYPSTEFSLLVGADNFANFSAWKNPSEILSLAKLIIYPRPGVELPQNSPSQQIIFARNLPQFEISATQIRSMLAQRMDLSYLLAPQVIDYIKKNKLYE